MHSLLPTLALTLRATAPRLSATTTAPSAPSALLPPDARPVNFWLLADRDADLTEDDAAVGAYWQRLRANESAETELAQLMRRPIAVEFELPSAAAEVFPWSEGEAAEEIGAGGQRIFLLPGGVGAVRIDETDSAAGGLGHGVWDAAIGLALWLASDPEQRVRGQSVLELGSGVGLGGISAARAGAARVTLSDVAVDAEADAERRQAAELGGQQLLQRLVENADLNGVGGSTSTLALDWADCLADEYQPTEHVADVVLGADVVHAMYGVSALAAAVAKHTRPGGGAAYLLSAQSRPGLDKLPTALRAAAVAAAAAAAPAEGEGGFGGCELEERLMTVFNSCGKADVVLTTFRRA